MILRDQGLSIVASEFMTRPHIGAASASRVSLLLAAAEVPAVEDPAVEGPAVESSPLEGTAVTSPAVVGPAIEDPVAD